MPHSTPGEPATDECAVMEDRSANDRRFAQDRSLEALKKAKESNPPITSTWEFLNLVKSRYLPPDIFVEYESIVLATWYERNRRPPPPVSSYAYSIPEPEAIDGLCDNTDDLPSVDPEADPRHIWVARPAQMRFAYATYKFGSRRGSYIRIVSVRNNRFIDEGDGMLEVQWIPCGPKHAIADHIAKHTLCRIVSEEVAKDMGMNVDIILGTDCREELELQQFVQARTGAKALANGM